MEVHLVRIFVTGASGWIGSATVHDLLAAGHQVTGLARSEASATALSAAGVAVHRGDLDDLESLRSAAASSDGVIHLAFKHDIAFTGDFQGAADADRRTVEIFGEALAGSDRPLVIASGTLGIAAGGVATERDGHDPDADGAAWGEGLSTRLATAELVISLASRSVCSSVVRLPPTNHGKGDNGFMATLAGIARAKEVAGYIDDGANRWPAVHRLDSAHLFQLAVELAAAGSTLHAVADEGVPIRDIAEIIGRHLGIPVVSIASEDAPEYFSWLAAFVGADGPAWSELTRELMGWVPAQPGLLDDLDPGHHFQKPSA